MFRIHFQIEIFLSFSDICPDCSLGSSHSGLIFVPFSKLPVDRVKSHVLPKASCEMTNWTKNISNLKFSYLAVPLWAVQKWLWQHFCKVIEKNHCQLAKFCFSVKFDKMAILFPPRTCSVCQHSFWISRSLFSQKWRARNGVQKVVLQSHAGCLISCFMHLLIRWSEFEGKSLL